MHLFIRFRDCDGTREGVHPLESSFTARFWFHAISAAAVFFENTHPTRCEIGGVDAEASFTTEFGMPVMHWLGQTFYLALGTADTPRQQNGQRFADWLLSDIGMRPIEEFLLDGATVFTDIKAENNTIVAPVFLGDALRGEAFSSTNSGLCYVIGARNRMKRIESTPSFALPRSLEDWKARSRSFFTSIPHLAIT
ncbi:hypothetical protein A9Q96_12900 [Rhodobacterales bacterium 52_120_T64]|nr:hypothetical protein A9Q96_12900 [Rhodobacterales bacterium 52_120_T64]